MWCHPEEGQKVSAIVCRVASQAMGLDAIFETAISIYGGVLASPHKTGS